MDQVKFIDQQKEYFPKNDPVFPPPENLPMGKENTMKIEDIRISRRILTIEDQYKSGMEELVHALKDSEYRTYGYFHMISHDGYDETGPESDLYRYIVVVGDTKNSPETIMIISYERENWFHGGVSDRTISLDLYGYMLNDDDKLIKVFTSVNDAIDIVLKHNVNYFEYMQTHVYNGNVDVCIGWQGGEYFDEFQSEFRKKQDDKCKEWYLQQDERK